MSWIGPVAKNAVKYGPQAKVVWDKGGKQAQEAAVRAARKGLARRKAFQKAEVVVDGAVIRTIHGGDTYWVVLGAEDRPLECYPDAPVPLEELLSGVDLSRKTTYAEWEAARLRHKVPSRKARPATPELE